MIFQHFTYNLKYNHHKFTMFFGFVLLMDFLLNVFLLPTKQKEIIKSSNKKQYYIHFVLIFFLDKNIFNLSLQFFLKFSFVFFCLLQNAFISSLPFIYKLLIFSFLFSCLIKILLIMIFFILNDKIIGYYNNNNNKKI